MVDNPAKQPTRTPRRARKKKAAVETRRQKEFLYRGRPLADLVQLSQEEQLALMPSRARRYFSRMPDDGAKLWAKIQAAGEGEEVRTHVREFPVMPALVGKIVHIHDGKEFQKIGITTEMIGHKLGEFALTRRTVKHTGPGVGATRSSKFMPLK